VQKLDRYIFKQLSLIFVFFLFVFTLIFWINRAIGLFDRLITDGHSSSTLFQFALLSLPSITTIVFPLACFAAVIFVTNRLKIDSEFTVLQSAGLSPWRLNKPYFIFGILCMLILGVFTTFVVPNTAKILHEKQLELDSSVSARLLKGGKFIHPFKGVTFYIKEIESDGTLLNVFLHDRRNRDEFLTYTATRAFLAKDENRTVLYMENGLIQTIGTSIKELSTTEFKSVAIDLSDAIKKGGNNTTYLSHVSTWLLIKNRQEVATSTRASAGSILLELHNRLHRPMFCFVAAILGFSSLLIGNYNRFGFGKQIALAVSIIVLIKITESYTTKLSLHNFLLWPLIYVPSLIGIISSVIFLKISASKYRLKYRATL
jgi:lipopolysaccharide export system permease protein